MTPASTRIQELLARYRPRFGDSESIRIRDMVGNLKKLHTSLERTKTGINAYERAKAKKTMAEEQIERLEASIISTLEKELSTY